MKSATKFILLIVLFLSFYTAKAQTFTITPVYTTLVQGGLIALTDACITFGIENNNPSGVNIEEVAYIMPASSTQTWTLWYKATPLMGNPGNITVANGWTSITSQVATSTGAGLTTVLTNIGFTIPANTTYRFALSKNDPLMDYGSTGCIPNNFTVNNVTLHVGNSTVSDGWSGDIVVMSFTPRFFQGSITLGNPCPPPPDTVYATICQGQVYNVGTSNYTTSGTYTDVFPFVDHPDCDSTVVTVLTVNPSYTTYIDTAIYEGDSVTIAGTHHKVEGTYNYNWQTVLGCDSNFTLKLKVIPWKLDTNVVHLCIGEKYYLDTVMYDKTGVYYDTFRYDWGHHFYRTELTVHQLPNIVITPKPENPDLICIHDSLDIEAKGAVYYEWNYITPKEELRFGDTTDKQTAFLYYDNTTIRVFGRDEWSCENTNEITINGEHCCQIFAPTAFSPNADGVNDKFEVYLHSNPHEYRLEVFNRYGQSIFITNNINHQWDGTLYNGDDAPNDTYFYIITGKCANFEPINFKSDVTIIR